MSAYSYLAIDPAGRERAGTVDADGPDAARAKLSARRLHVVRIGEGADAAVAAGPAGGRLSARQLTLFTRQLATLASITPLEEAVRAIGRQEDSARAAAVLGRVHAGVLEGRRLSDSMAREPLSFPPLYRAMVAAGEASGSLPAILSRVAELLERQARTRAKVLSALAYPTVLTVVAVGVVAALMIFVVPKVVEQFENVGQRLPLLTRIVIGLSDFLAGGWWALLAMGVAAVVVGRRALADPATRLRFDRWLLTVPGLGRLLRDAEAARIARTLSTMVASRLPLLEALALVEPTVRNHALRAGVGTIMESVRQGGSFSAALRRTGLFPPLLATMTASGEATGRLDQLLESAADYLEREFDAFTSAALSLLEPAIILIMGAAVAGIVLSILLPILQLNTLAR